jgi:hypothetical protein
MTTTNAVGESQCPELEPLADDRCKHPEGHEGGHETSDGLMWMVREAGAPEDCGGWRPNGKGTATCCLEAHDGLHISGGGLMWDDTVRTFRLVLSSGESVTWRGAADDGHHAARQYVAANPLYEVVGFAELEG